MSLREKNRLFIATFFEDENLCNLINQLSSETDNNLKIVPGEKIHITWKYIGDIDLGEKEKVFNALNEHSSIIKNCSLVFDKLEVWPNLKRPRLLSLTARKYDKKVTDFLNNLEESLYKNLNIKKENARFIPHITVARIKKSNEKLALLKNTEFEPIKLEIKHARVVQSINIKNEILYQILYNENL